MAQSFPGALPILHLHDERRLDPLRYQIGSQLPEVIAKHGDGSAGAGLPLQGVKLCQQHAAGLFGQARSHEPRIRDLATFVVLREDQVAETVRSLQATRQSSREEIRAISSDARLPAECAAAAICGK